MRDDARRQAAALLDHVTRTIHDMLVDKLSASRLLALSSPSRLELKLQLSALA